MDPFLTTILKKAPKAIKLIPTSFLDEGDIIDAIDAGYEITEDTPARLLKFSAIRKKFHEKYYDAIKNGTLTIRVEELINILSDKDYFPYYATDSILEKIQNASEKEKQQVLDVILQHVDIIEPTKLQNLIYNHQEVAYKFLEANPNGFKSIAQIAEVVLNTSDVQTFEASPEIIELDYERIYEILKHHKDSFDFSTINKGLFEVWIKYDKSILLKQNLSDEVKKDSKFKEHLKNSGFSLEEIADVDLVNDSVGEHILYVLEQDFSFINRIKKDIWGNYEVNEKIGKIFINDLGHNLQYLPQLSSKICYDYIPYEGQEKIIEYIIQNPVEMEYCLWNFITMNTKASFACITKNPNILLQGWIGLIYAEKKLTDDELEYLISLIKDGKVVFTEIDQTLYHNPKLLEAVISINPHIIFANPNSYAVDYSKINQTELVEGLITNNYKIDENTPKFLFKNSKFMYYILKSGQQVQSTEHIENFITFENMYIFKDKELFKYYISQNYCKEYCSYFEIFGIESLIELAEKYGYILNKKTLSITDNLDEIQKKIHSFISKSLCNQNNNEQEQKFIIDAIIRSEYPLLKSQLSKHSFLTSSDEIFRYVLNYNSELIKLYTGKNDEIYELAVEKGYKLTQKDYEKITPFQESVFMSKIAYEINTENVYLFRGNDENYYKYIVEEKNFIPNYSKTEQCERMRLSASIIRRGMKKNIDFVFLYTGPITELSDIFDITDEKGNKLELTSTVISKLPYIHNSLELMERAIKFDMDNMNYCTNPPSELVEIAIKLGYKPSIDFKYKLSYYIGNDREVINQIYKLLLEEKYSEVIKTPEELEVYITLWKNYNDLTTHRTLTYYMTPENYIALEKMNMDFLLLLKYALNNDKLPYYIKLIEMKELDIFVDLYNKINTEIVMSNNAHGIDLILKTARFFNKYPKLSKEIVKHELSNSQKTVITKLINSNQTLVNINTIDDVDNYEEKLKNEIEEILNKPDVTPREIKDILLKYVFDLDYQEFENILENHINSATIKKIRSKCSNPNSEVYIAADFLLGMMTMLEETVNASNDVDKLKDLLQRFVECGPVLDEARVIFYDLKELIRNIYELDAINSLTDLDDKKLPKRKSQRVPSKNITELKNSKYTIYAHVMTGKNYEEYVNYRFNGRVTICVSPISNLGKELYSAAGVVLGFTKIPKGSFIGSSNQNMDSNCYILDNNYEVETSHFYQLEITDSSALRPKNHSETLLYRDELIPSCIIIRREEPSDEELEAQEKLSKVIREKFGYGEDFEIPLVHTQEIEDIAELKDVGGSIIPSTKEQESSSIEEPSEIIEKIQDAREGLEDLRERVEELQIEKSPVYNIIRKKIGGSHDMFQCNLSFRKGDYYLKPGYSKDGAQIDSYRAYAMKASYELQKIVNPKNAVFVELVEVPLAELEKKGSDSIICSVIEIIEKSTRYSNSKEIAELKEKEMEAFLCEFITDYLLFSYDTKAENFVHDENFNTYGIDKEQALKFVLYPDFAIRGANGNIESFDTSMSKSIQFDPNNCDIIYKSIFRNIANGTQTITESMFKKAEEAIARVESISDEEYIKIFQNFIENFSTSSALEQTRNVYISNGYTPEEALNQLKYDLYASLLARKHNLRKEFNLYFTELITKYYQSRGEELPEWIKTQQLSI